jgi:hypothetical protein
MISDVRTLTNALSWWEFGGYIALFFVFVGVVGESIAEFTDWIKGEARKKQASRAFAFVLILGLGGRGYHSGNHERNER